MLCGKLLGSDFRGFRWRAPRSIGQRSGEQTLPPVDVAVDQRHDPVDRYSAAARSIDASCWRQLGVTGRRGIEAVEPHLIANTPAIVCPSQPNLESPSQKWTPRSPITPRPCKVGQSRKYVRPPNVVGRVVSDRVEVKCNVHCWHGKPSAPQRNADAIRSDRVSVIDCGRVLPQGEPSSRDPDFG